VLVRSCAVRFVGILFFAALFSFLIQSSLAAQTIKLHVDLTDAPRNIYHAHLSIPAKSGAMTLVFMLIGGLVVAVGGPLDE